MLRGRESYYHGPHHIAQSHNKEPTSYYSKKYKQQQTNYKRLQIYKRISNERQITINELQMTITNDRQMQPLQPNYNHYKRTTNVLQITITNDRQTTLQPLQTTTTELQTTTNVLKMF